MSLAAFRALLTEWQTDFVARTGRKPSKADIPVAALKKQLAARNSRPSPAPSTDGSVCAEAAPAQRAQGRTGPARARGKGRPKPSALVSGFVPGNTLVPRPKKEVEPPLLLPGLASEQAVPAKPQEQATAPGDTSLTFSPPASPNVQHASTNTTDEPDQRDELEAQACLDATAPDSPDHALAAQPDTGTSVAGTAAASVGAGMASDKAAGIATRKRARATSAPVRNTKRAAVTGGNDQHRQQHTGGLHGPQKISEHRHVACTSGDGVSDSDFGNNETEPDHASKMPHRCKSPDSNASVLCAESPEVPQNPVRSGGKLSADGTEQAPRPRNAKKPEKVVYDQMGRCRVQKATRKVAPGDGPRMVSQNFRRHGNMNKKMTRENRGRGGNKAFSGGRGRGRGSSRGGRGSKSAGWRGLTQTHTFDLGEGSSFGGGPSSAQFTTGFQADPYGVLGAGRLADLCDLQEWSPTVPGAGEQQQPMPSMIAKEMDPKKDCARADVAAGSSETAPTTQKQVQVQAPSASLMGSSDGVAQVPLGTSKIVDSGGFGAALSGVAGALVKKVSAPKSPSSSSASGLSAVLHGTQPVQLPKARTVSADIEKRLTAVLRDNFGHPVFREGQAWAIDRVLRGKSCMAILPTGAGKSLCYQVAAFMLRPCVALVISPLVSLMQDQLLNLPAGLRGGCISSNQKYTANRKAEDALTNGELDVLYISPERLYDAKFLQRLADLPPGRIAFACIDEAHCISQWSHNFRPSYLRLDIVLRQKLGITCILGLTATATAQTENSVRSKLCIPREGVWRSSTLRPNLNLSVSVENDRRNALLTLHRTPKYRRAKSIIIYAFYRNDVDDLARYLASKMLSADGYHAGKDVSIRARIQGDFMKGKLRIVVATVAFGMGIDKADVGGVIHYSLPSSMEAYVQEVGRAGRDGKPAFCHLFLSTGDYMRRRSLASSEGLDRSTMETALRNIFSVDRNATRATERMNGWTEGGIGTGYVPPAYETGWHRMVSCGEDEAKREYDTTIDVFTTVCTYLEVGTPKYLAVESVAAVVKYSIQFFKTSISRLTELSPLVACIVSSGTRKKAKYEFDVARVCNVLQMSTSDLVQGLRQLKSNGEIDYEPVERGLVALVQLEPTEQDVVELAAALHKKTSELERCNIEKIDAIYKVMVHCAQKPSKSSSGKIADSSGDEADAAAPDADGDDTDGAQGRPSQPQRIQRIIERYFGHFAAEGEGEGDDSKQSGSTDPALALPAPSAPGEKTDGEPKQQLLVRKGGTMLCDAAMILGDIKRFVRAFGREAAVGKNVGQNLDAASGVMPARAVARIFHGLTSPQYPAYVWNRNPYWAKHKAADFQLILELATRAVETGALARSRSYEKEEASAASAPTRTDTKPDDGGVPTPATEEGSGQLLAAETSEEEDEHGDEQLQGMPGAECADDSSGEEL